MLIIAQILNCVACDRQVQAGIFNGDFSAIFVKLSVPLAVVGLGILYFSSKSGSTASKNLYGKKGKSWPVLSASLLLGIGMGGFVDGILLHQILQWHQMISNIVPPDNLAAKNINMFWDGIFHAFTWSITLAGILLMWQNTKRDDLYFSDQLFAGSLLMGWGIFNFIDSIFNHYLFQLHNVREITARPDLYNLGFLIFALLLISTGGFLIEFAMRKNLQN